MTNILSIPKISVITICFNAAEHIGETIMSIRRQRKNSDFEYIVIDGGSTDGTVDTIRQNADVIDDWSSEPDDGIADAMNKGVLKASGDYVFFLHADDYFDSDNALKIASKGLKTGEDIVVYDVLFESNTSRRRLKPRPFNFYANLKMPFCHQGVFCKKSLFEQVGLFDTSYQICMDYDFFLRAYRARASFKRVPGALCVMRDTGVSSRKDWPSLYKRLMEERRIHLSYQNGYVMSLVYAFWWLLYPRYRNLRARLDSTKPKS